MWDNPAALNRLASALFAVATALVLGALALRAAALPAFALREVRVEGPLAHVTRAQVEEVVRRELRGTLFTVDLARVRAAFERLPWVRRAAVRREWPPRLAVTLEEHVPFARWHAGGLVNTHGDLFDAAYEGELPVLAGPRDAAREMAIQLRYFRRTLEPVGEQPVAVELNERRAWTLRLASGLTVALGREHVEKRLARFAGTYARTIGALGRRIEYVDLRYAHGFAVRVPGLRGEHKHRQPPRRGEAGSAGRA